MDKHLKKLEWLPELLGMVRRELNQRQQSETRDRPTIEAERDALNKKIKGWTESLAKTDLPPKLRAAIEKESAAALARVEEVELKLEEGEAQETRAEQIIDENEVLRCLLRLEDVLANECPTLANLILSLHIDRIVAHKDGRVVMRTCKLGSFPGALDLLIDEHQADVQHSLEEQSSGYRPKLRRRGRVRLDFGERVDFDLEAAANMAADPNRFASLPEKWFWIDEFTIPAKPLSWAEANAEAVFRRRQEGRLSFAKLGKEFGVTAPTARAAVRQYLDDHPDAQDEVNLPRGGRRPPKFDLTKFGNEARALWDAGWSKLKLAEKYGCSTPVIDKALAYAYEQAGLPAPTRASRYQEKVSRARTMLNQGEPLDGIAKKMGVSDVTARSYLRESFKAEGKRMPDLRRSQKHGK